MEKGLSVFGKRGGKLESKITAESFQGDSKVGNVSFKAKNFLRVEQSSYFQEPVEIMDVKIKLASEGSRYIGFKVRWNSRRGPEFTWEREDSFKQKYP
ncbi:hypothetical protein Tco_1531365 [Tanacetum coccineum]